MEVRLFDVHSQHEFFFIILQNADKWQSEITDFSEANGWKKKGQKQNNTVVSSDNAPPPSQRPQPYRVNPPLSNPTKRPVYMPVFPMCSKCQ